MLSILPAKYLISGFDAHAFNRRPILLNKAQTKGLFSFFNCGLNRFFGKGDPVFFCRKKL